MPASKSIPHIQAAVTFSRHCGGWKRGRGPLKEWLKVGDKNKLGEGRKLIIHNRQFTWMNTTETEKLRLLPSKEKKPFSGWGNFYSATTVVIFIWLQLKWGMQQGFFLRRSSCQTKQTKLSFQILHAGAHVMHPLKFRPFPGTKIKLPDQSTSS